MLELLALRLADRGAPAIVRALVDALAQEGVLRHAVGNGKRRQRRSHPFEFEAALVRDLRGLVQSRLASQPAPPEVVGGEQLPLAVWMEHAGLQRLVNGHLVSQRGEA